MYMVIIMTIENKTNKTTKFDLRKPNDSLRFDCLLSGKNKKSISQLELCTIIDCDAIYIRSAAVDALPNFSKSKLSPLFYNIYFTYASLSSRNVIFSLPKHK